MYVIAVYDVGQKRVGKMLKLCRRYLNWIQNSVLEGELTRAQFERLKTEVRNTIEEDEDSVLFYVMRREEDVRRESLGIEKGMPEWIL